MEVLRVPKPSSSLSSRNKNQKMSEVEPSIPHPLPWPCYTCLQPKPDSSCSCFCSHGSLGLPPITVAQSSFSQASLRAHRGDPTVSHPMSLWHPILALSPTRSANFSPSISTPDPVLEPPLNPLASYPPSMAPCIPGAPATTFANTSALAPCRCQQSLLSSCKELEVWCHS